MSLRKSTCLTPQRLDAARRNSQRSTGPRSEAGKERMKMNALQHGCDAAPENEAAVMRALGEDPERYAALQQELATTYGPGDALWDQQLADLGKLYWRRNRIERMQTGLMRRALQAVEERQHERRRELAACTFEPSQAGAMDLLLAQPGDPAVWLRLLLSLLGALREQAQRRVFKPQQRQRIEPYYQDQVGWRPARFLQLLRLFIGRANAEQQGEQALHDFVSQYFEGGEAAVETHYQELLTMLEEEIADREEEFQDEVEAQKERDAADRDACLAPAGETWEILLRQEMALDRSIDRKVRIILTMRQEHARGRGGSRTAPAQPEEVAPTFRSAGADLKVSATDHETESPAEENAAETSKSPEQSENVIENKGPAAEGVAA